MAARSTTWRIAATLISIGEDMVNIAFDAPLDMPPSTQIEDAERRLFELAETGRYDGGFQSFNDAVSLAIDMAGAAYQRDGGLSGISTGISSLDAAHGRIAAFRLDRACRTSGHGQDLAGHQHRLQHRPGL
jgi:replicative DNA helicase